MKTKSAPNLRPFAGAVVTLLYATTLVTATFAFASQETYSRADIDQSGELRIVTTSGRVIVPRRQMEQVGFDKVAVAPNRRAVGWVALYPNCCTSYPIPLKLMIYVNGRSRTFTGNGLPIWRWGFAAGGDRLAFRQETVHGGLGVHYELRHVGNGRLIAEYNPDRETAGDLPHWVRELDSDTPTEELKQIEQQLAAAWKSGNCEAWGAFLAPDWSVTHITGAVITKPQAMQMCQTREPPIETLASDELSVRSFGDAAVVTGRTIATIGGATPETVTLRFTDVFIRRDGRWLAVASHATRLTP